jgi:hypothetical protein
MVDTGGRGREWRGDWRRLRERGKTTGGGRSTMKPIPSTKPVGKHTNDDNIGLS